MAVLADGDALALEAARQRALGRSVVVIQGLGFVGVAVAAVVAAARTADGQPRYFVIGVDQATSAGYRKVSELAAGRPVVNSPDERLPRLLREAVCEIGNLQATVAETAYSLADIIVMDVQLDVRDRTVADARAIELDLGAFRAAVRAVGRHMRADALVLVETTVPMGACAQIVQPTLEAERRARGITVPVQLAHAYERVMPGAGYVDSIRRFWRVYSGVDEPSAARARDFLASFTDTAAYPLTQLADPVASEMAKLLENSYRAVNIAFIHEWTLLAEELGVNLFEVVSAIRKRQGTHDNMRTPGFGVGGYCLTKDSLLAQWSASSLFGTEVTLQLTMEALRINHAMPLHTLDLLRRLAGGELRGRRVLIAGVAYLPDVGDTRNSPAELLADRLLAEDVDLLAHDPCIARWPEREQVRLTADLHSALAWAEAVVFAVPHRSYRALTAEEMLRAAQAPLLIVDAQNMLSDTDAATLHAAGCRLAGVGKGHWRKRGYECQ